MYWNGVHCEYNILIINDFCKSLLGCNSENRTKNTKIVVGKKGGSKQRVQLKAMN